LVPCGRDDTEKTLSSIDTKRQKEEERFNEKKKTMAAQQA
jgi:hypothetical protein